MYRPIPAETLRLLVCDLDGTLIDSKRDLVESVNAALGAFDLPAQAPERIASYIGDGAGMLVARALDADGADPGLQPAVLEAFLSYYREHLLDHTLPYPGVVAALEQLPGAKAVLTNKPVRASRDICAGLGLSRFFFEVYGGNSFPTKKPDPEGLLKLMVEAGARPEETVMIGDSDVDVRTARAAGAWALGCRYGLSPHGIADMEARGLVDAVVDSAAEWVRVLGAEVRHGL